MEKLNERLLITGVPVDNIATAAEALQVIEKNINDPETEMLHVVFINAHVVNTAWDHPDFKALLQRNRLNLPDGIGVWIAGKVLYRKSLSNLNGTDFGITLLQWLSKKGFKIFFIGAREGVAQKAKENLEKMIPGLHVAGCHHGYFTHQDNRSVIECINRSGADILFVCMGVPQQELWLDLNKCNCPGIKMACSLGAFFDFYSGRIKRAPLFIRKIRLEWLYRFIQEPIRLWKRYLIGNFRFLFLIFSKNKPSNPGGV